MLNKTSLSILLTALLMASAGAKGQPPSTQKILIVYLSRTHNTQAIAEIIHKYMGGTLVSLELEKPYPENYQQTVQQVVHENETGYLPPLKTKIDSIQHYDIIFVGFPTWDMQIPPPMKSFLHEYDLSGKTVVPFNTNAGYGVGSGFASVKLLCPPQHDTRRIYNPRRHRTRWSAVCHQRRKSRRRGRRSTQVATTNKATQIIVHFRIVSGGLSSGSSNTFRSLFVARELRSFKH